MKTTLSSLEVTYLVKELQVLVGAKVEKVFQTNKPKEDFLFSLHISGVGKKFLFLSLPNLLCLTSFKPSFPQLPPSFCSSLRRKITNARIVSIEQVDFERIVKIVFSTKLGVSNLIIELLSPGNIILTLPDEDDRIIAVLHPKIWNDKRKILPNKPYVFPAKQLDPRTLSLKDFSKLVKSSNKESIVKTLAIETSLGGLFAKEVLFPIEISQSIPPKDLSDDQILLIFNSLNELFSKEISASLVDGNALPFSLSSFSSGEKKGSFNKAIASLALANLERAEEKEFNKSSKDELSKVQKILRAQSNSLNRLEQAQVEKRKKGELIYANYGKIDSLLKKISLLRKTLSWNELKDHFKDHPLKVQIDEHNGLLVVELNE